MKKSFDNKPLKILAGGCFNVLHPGHEYFLKEAKKLGDILVVVITNDANNKKPYAIPAERRKDALQKLSIADKIIIGNSDDFSAVVISEKPDIIALGYDQQLMEPTKKEAEKMGIKVNRIGKLGNYSTRNILKNDNRKNN